jgi:hypothetical protein
MATNAFIEFRLDEAQALADYTSIAFDLRTAREFATTIIRYRQSVCRGSSAQTLPGSGVNPDRLTTFKAPAFYTHPR